MLVFRLEIIKRKLLAMFSSSSLESGLVISTLMNKIAMALVTSIFAVGGAMIGSITGALKGQTTETGMLRGLGVGAVVGAITGVQLMELVVNGEPLSKVALICSLLNGKVFREWLSHFVLEAYQWQTSSMESSSFNDVSEFTSATFIGLPEEVIKELPVITYELNKAETTNSCSRTSCAICIQDLRDGECTRLLPSCAHLFHVHCIDEWLSRRATCPICRQHVRSLSA